MKNTISGFGWQTALRFATMLVVLGKIMFIARILTPNDFGLFALIAITLGLAEATTETGINFTIIQSKSSVKYFLDTAWVIAIGRGFLIGIIMVIMGILMSRFYHEPSLTILIATAALVPVVKGFINPSIVLFHKNLQFFKDTLFKFIVIIFEVGATVCFAFVFKSVSALVLGLIAGGLFEVLLSFVVFKEKPSFIYIPNRAKVIFSNAKGLSISAALSYINENIDDFILGKTLGTFSLGLYHNAYSLSHKVSYDFARSANHSVFPVFAKIADDVSRLKRAFIKSILITTVIVTGLSVPLLLAPEFFVNLILGNQWVSIVPYLNMFVFAGILQSITIIFYALFYSKRNYSTVNFHLLLTIALLVSLLIILPRQYGLQGAGVALVVSRLVTTPILFIGTVSLFRGK